jgi:4-aminobutyrate aminotransferase / (S)-3-amino-2-methylpropionate transaminase
MRARESETDQAAALAATAGARRALATAVWPEEPRQPEVRTPVPGPRSQQLQQHHGRFQDPRSIMFVQDPDRSIGNYIADADGNLLLDLYNQIASIAVGYNNPRILAAAASPEWARYTHRHTHFLSLSLWLNDS